MTGDRVPLPPDLDACPLLGLPNDPSTHFAFAHRAHLCHATPRPASVDVTYQARLCLTAGFPACDRYRAWAAGVAATAGPPPEPEMVGVMESVAARVAAANDVAAPVIPPPAEAPVLPDVAFAPAPESGSPALTTAASSLADSPAAEPAIAEALTEEPPAPQPAVATPRIAELKEAEPPASQPLNAEPTLQWRIAEPSQGAPWIAKPDVAEPSLAEPVSAEPSPAEPAISEPDIAEPILAAPETPEPEVTAPPKSERPITRPVDRPAAWRSLAAAVERLSAARPKAMPVEPRPASSASAEPPAEPLPAASVAPAEPLAEPLSAAAASASPEPLTEPLPAPSVAPAQPFADPIPAATSGAPPEILAEPLSATAPGVSPETPVEQLPAAAVPAGIEAPAAPTMPPPIEPLSPAPSTDGPLEARSAAGSTELQADLAPAERTIPGEPAESTWVAVPMSTTSSAPTSIDDPIESFLPVARTPIEPPSAPLLVPVPATDDDDTDDDHLADEAQATEPPTDFGVWSTPEEEVAADDESAPWSPVGDGSGTASTDRLAALNVWPDIQPLSLPEPRPAPPPQRPLIGDDSWPPAPSLTGRSAGATTAFAPTIPVVPRSSLASSTPTTVTMGRAVSAPAGRPAAALVARTEPVRATLDAAALRRTRLPLLLVLLAIAIIGGFAAGPWALRQLTGGDAPTPSAAGGALASAAPSAQPTVLPTTAPSPVASPTATPLSSPQPSARPAFYIVQPGDSLGSIANRFGTTVQRLQQLNHISNPNRISVGQKILLPTN